MSTTVYAVSSGTYSDYRVHALFTTRNGAEQHANTRNTLRSRYEDANVEAFPVYNEGEQPKLVTTYHATATRPPGCAATLNNPEPRVTEIAEWDYDADLRDRALLGGYAGPIAYSTNRDRAIKAWQDKRAERLAQEAGVA